MLGAWGSILWKLIKDVFNSNQEELKKNTEKITNDMPERAQEIAEQVPGLNYERETPSGTPEATPSGTPEATPSGTPEATPSGTPEATIPDETNKNMEYPIGKDWQNYLEKMQERQWEREDAIRKETQMREDTAYQRARADAEKAGINLNLTGINPASSGGGITQATGMNYGPYETAIQEALKLWETELENDTKIDENTKDRWTEILGSVLQTVLITAITSGKIKIK